MADMGGELWGAAWEWYESFRWWWEFVVDVLVVAQGLECYLGGCVFLWLCFMVFLIIMFGFMFNSY